MTKDIFVDNDASMRFGSPMARNFAKLYDWLFDHGLLVVSSKIIKEYHDSHRGVQTSRNVIVLYNYLLTRGRIVKIKNKDLDQFDFTPAREKELRSNHKDHVHIKTILLSTRKMGVIIDKKLKKDLELWGNKVTISSNPDLLKYS